MQVDIKFNFEQQYLASEYNYCDFWSRIQFANVCQEV